MCKSVGLRGCLQSKASSIFGIILADFSIQKNPKIDRSLLRRHPLICGDSCHVSEACTSFFLTVPIYWYQKVLNITLIGSKKWQPIHLLVPKNVIVLLLFLDEGELRDAKIDDLRDGR